MIKNELIRHLKEKYDCKENVLVSIINFLECLESENQAVFEDETTVRYRDYHSFTLRKSDGKKEMVRFYIDSVAHKDTHNGEYKSFERMDYVIL